MSLLWTQARARCRVLNLELERLRTAIVVSNTLRGVGCRHAPTFKHLKQRKGAMDRNYVVCMCNWIKLNA